MERFTWFAKFTQTVEKVPEAQRFELLWAMVRYGTYGEEPNLDYPLDAIFESVKEDIDNSRKAHANGKRGGRGNRKTPSNPSVNPFKDPFEAIPNQYKPIQTNTNQNMKGGGYEQYD